MRLVRKSDTELGAEVVKLRDQRRAFGRANNGLFREDAERRIADRIAEARERFEVQATGFVQGGFGVSLEDLIHSAILSDDRLEARLRDVLARMPDEMFLSGSRTEADAELARFDARIEEIERELERRRRQRAVDEAKAELARRDGICSASRGVPMHTSLSRCACVKWRPGRGGGRASRSRKP